MYFLHFHLALFLFGEGVGVCAAGFITQLRYHCRILRYRGKVLFCKFSQNLDITHLVYNKPNCLKETKEGAALK